MKPSLGAIALTAAVAVAGCGSGGGHATALQREVTVIRGWSQALRRGDVEAAARYFAIPSLFVNGVELRIRSRADAARANAGLTCGARLVSAKPRGKYVEASFVLTGRPGPGGTDCGPGAGSTARTDFLIERGRIVAWIRAPDATPSTSGPPVKV